MGKYAKLGLNIAIAIVPVVVKFIFEESFKK